MIIHQMMSNEFGVLQGKDQLTKMSFGEMGRSFYHLRQCILLSNIIYCPPLLAKARGH